MDPNNQNDQAFANFSYPTVGAQPGSVSQPAHAMPLSVDPELDEQLQAQQTPSAPLPSGKPDDLDSQISGKKINETSDLEALSEAEGQKASSVAPPTFGSPEIKSEEVTAKDSGGSKNPLRSLAKKLSGMGSGLVEEEVADADQTEPPKVSNDSDTLSDGPAVVLDQPLPSNDGPTSDASIQAHPSSETDPNISDPSTSVLNIDDVSGTDEMNNSIASSVGSALEQIGQKTEQDTEVPVGSVDIGPIDNDPSSIGSDNPSFNDPATNTSESEITDTVVKDTMVTDTITSNTEEDVAPSSLATVPEKVDVEAPGLNFVQMDPDISSGTDSMELPPVENSPDMSTRPFELTTGPASDPSVVDLTSTVDANPIPVSVDEASTPSNDNVTHGPTLSELVSEDQSSVTTGSKGRYPYTIEQLLDIVVERDASDLHLTVGYPAMIRVDGELINVIDELVTPEQAVDLILPVLPEQKKELLEVNREVDLAYSHRGMARFRINAYYQQQSLAGAFRLIPNKIRNIDELKLPQVYHQITKLKQGLVLVTGPTGSGKSTTLAAILQEINETRPDHIITIEDPVEYVFPKARAMVDQRELHEDTHSWEIALKSALRQDPDVMLVGEMRDFDTISSAITLAETGHLVFATLHTNSAAQTIDRIIDVFPEHQQSQVRSQLSNTIEAVIAQRLIPISAGGRRAVSEIMLATPAIRNLIRESKVHQIDNVIRTSADIGMISLEHSLVKLVRDNIITMEKAQEYAVHPEEVIRLLKS